MFHSFGEALVAFLSEHDFISSQLSISVERCIRNAFEKASITVLRSLPRWFLEDIRPSRRTAFQICFAMGLSFDCIQNFFRRVVLQRGVDCHDQTEAAYYFALRHSLSYHKIATFLQNLSDFPAGTTNQHAPLIFTTDIMNKIDPLETLEDLSVFLIKTTRETRGLHKP
jgi:hypothetical protein